MIQRTYQEVADFFGLWLVKDNLHGLLGNKDTVTAFAHRPELVEQRRGRPCYVDLYREPDAPVDSYRFNLEDIIPDVSVLISDIDEMPTHTLIEPARTGNDGVWGRMWDGHTIRLCSDASKMKRKEWDTSKGRSTDLFEKKNPEEKYSWERSA